MNTVPNEPITVSTAYANATILAPVAPPPPRKPNRHERRAAAARARRESPPPRRITVHVDPLLVRKRSRE